MFGLFGVLFQVFGFFLVISSLVLQRSSVVLSGPFPARCRDLAPILGDVLRKRRCRSVGHFGIWGREERGRPLWGAP